MVKKLKQTNKLLKLGLVDTTEQQNLYEIGNSSDDTKQAEKRFSLWCQKLKFNSISWLLRKLRK